MSKPTCIADHPDYDKSIYGAFDKLKLPYVYDSENDSGDEEDYEGMERDIIVEILLQLEDGRYINFSLEEAMTMKFQLRMANFVIKNYPNENPVKPVVKEWLDTYRMSRLNKK